jgi:phosphate/sulfate permease
MGLILVGTLSYSWYTYNGDISYQRLNTPGLDVAPETFEFLQVAAPIILLILTRLRMPVSTSILLLSAFSTKSSSIGSILTKSFTGYILAFFAAIIIWSLVTKWLEKKADKKPGPLWLPFQWITSGVLWSVWIMQDVSNIAVILPRQLSFTQFVIFAAYLFFGLGVLFYLKGDKIQAIVNEKEDTTNVRAATIVDLVYAALLYYLKVISTIPISTTWVFIGLLGGREIAINMMRKNPAKRVKGVQKAFQLVRKDALYAGIGLVVSIILAISINETMRAEIFDYIIFWD